MTFPAQRFGQIGTLGNICTKRRICRENKLEKNSAHVFRRHRQPWICTKQSWLQPWSTLDRSSLGQLWIATALATPSLGSTPHLHLAIATIHVLFAFFRNDSIHLVVESPRRSPGQSHPGCSWRRNHQARPLTSVVLGALFVSTRIFLSRAQLTILM